MTLSSVEISVVVVSFNTRRLLIEMLESLHKNTLDSRFETIVCDNRSSDDSVIAVAEAFPHVRLISLDHNAGFAAGNNVAARSAKGEWLLLLNPDTVILDQAVDRLMEFARSHPEASIFGGRTLFSDGSLNPGSCWRRPTVWSVFCAASGLTALFPKIDVFARESYGGWKRDYAREVDIVSGCFLLLRKQVWEELGGFDPAFFMYGEEADLCLRAKRLGHRCMITPNATIVHYGGASERVRADKMVRLFKAKSQLFDRHWPVRWRSVGIRCLDLWAFTRTAVFFAVKWLRPRWTESYRTWREIWIRRPEWRAHRPLS